MDAPPTVGAKPDHHGLVVVDEHLSAKCSVPAPVMTHECHVWPERVNGDFGVRARYNPIARVLDGGENRLSIHHPTIRRDLDIVGGHHSFNERGILRAPRVKPHGG